MHVTRDAAVRGRRGCVRLTDGFDAQAARSLAVVAVISIFCLPPVSCVW